MAVAGNPTVDEIGAADRGGDAERGTPLDSPGDQQTAYRSRHEAFEESDVV
jgi:hypothetical protein